MHLLPISRPLAQTRAQELFELFLVSRDLRPATIEIYRFGVGKFLDPDLTPPDPKDWTRATILRWKASLQQSSYAPASKSNIERSTMTFIRWLIENEDCPDGILRGYRMTRVPERVQRTADTDILNKLVLAARAPVYGGNGARIGRRYVRRNLALLAVLWATGARRSELASVTLDDYDRQNAVIVLRHTKTGRVRTVPVERTAQRMLLDYLAHDRGREPGPLFEMSSDAMRNVLRRLAEHAGVEASSHDFRRGFGARARMSGMDSLSIQQIFGHTTLSMTRQYTKAVEEQAAIREYREKLG